MRRPVPASGRSPLRSGEGLARHFVTLNPLMPSGWWTFLFTAVLSGSSLYAANGGGSQSLLVYFMAAAGLVALFPSLTVQSTRRNLILLGYPAWLVLSIGWSIAPDRTLHEIGLIVPTMLAGLTLGGARNAREVNLGGAAGMFGFILFSLAHGGHTAFSDTGSGGDALSGLGTGKNFFGHLAAMSALLSVSFFAYAGARFGRVLVLVGVADLLVSGYALVGSHATGSILACAMGLAVFLVALLFPRVHWGLRVLLLATLAAIAIVYVTFGAQIQQMVGDALLTKFNKDSTLTGRTVLWDYADRFIEDHRMLGYGYGAFWYLTNPDAWTIWRVASVAPMSGFNFHNTVRETLIESGVVGFAIYVATFGWAFLRTFLRNIVAGDVPSALRIAFIFYFIVRMPVESTGFAPVTFDCTLLLAFLCAPVRPPALQRADRSAPARRERALAPA